jgi:pimeloyl-ACP methyl ester carboxylesterase
VCSQFLEIVMNQKNQSTVTAVLVHGAWADGSSWNKVIAQLRHRGIAVVAAQIPLTSLADDAAALRRTMRRSGGPLVLVGHSYGGAVATAAGAGDSRVKGLVYIAAIVPQEGETVGEVFGREPPHPRAPQLAPDEDGLLWLEPEAFRDAVAPDAAPETAAQLAAVQKPIAVKCLGEPMGRPAWKEVPTWFLIADHDRMVSPATQRCTAERMKATVVALPVDHWPLASSHMEVADIIEDAVRLASISGTAA